MFPIGRPAQEDEYFERRELKEVLKAIENGRDVFLLGPRRSGKTSLLRRVRHVLESDQKAPKIVSVDLQGERNIWAVLAKLAPETKEDSILEHTRFNRNPDPEAMMDLANQVMEEATRRHGRLLLLLDEVGYFIREDEQMELMLRFLEVCLRFEKVTVLLAGEAFEYQRFISYAAARSANFDRVFSGRFRVIYLSPMNKAEMVEFVRRLTFKHPEPEYLPSQRNIEDIIALTAPAWPFELLMILNALEEERRDSPNENRHPNLEEVIRQPIRRFYGHGIEDTLLYGLRKRDIPLAHKIFEMLAETKGELTTEDIANSDKRSFTTSEVTTVAKHLEDLGVLRAIDRDNTLEPLTGLTKLWIKAAYGDDERQFG